MSRLHRRDKPEEEVRAEYEPPGRETKPAPKEDIGGGDVCPKCGRKGRAPGHH